MVFRRIVVFTPSGKSDPKEVTSLGMFGFQHKGITKMLVTIYQRTRPNILGRRATINFQVRLSLSG